ncbi:DsbA family protein [Seohaeicola saemankumensis]|nr:DsbA family protein [Seohaeicola saemankumensis]MCA0869438.1 DsbA family protein [Seohaeicola saemankumensis]
MKTTWIAATLALAIVASARADDFDARVRAYILNNPEIILEALEILSEREARAETTARIAAFPDLFSDAPALGLGAPDAPIRVVEFFDYKCGPCKAMHPAVAEAVRQHPDLRVELRQLPILSPASERAARFALAVRALYGADAYARAHDRLWQHRGPFNTSVLARIAEHEGWDPDALDAETGSAEITARIDRNRTIAMDLGIRGTPAFVTPTSVTFGQGDVGALAERWLQR